MSCPEKTRDFNARGSGTFTTLEGVFWAVRVGGVVARTSEYVNGLVKGI